VNRGLNARCGHRVVVLKKLGRAVYGTNIVAAFGFVENVHEHGGPLFLR
jgi:hypothetical protein